MQIRARMSMSADGYVTTPSGWPALTADPAFVSGESHGIREFLEGCEAALMGRTTFEPALNNDRWPWPTLNVFVLASDRPAGTPDHVVTDSDPARLLEKIRAANQGRDVHLVGGPRTIEAFRALGALDKLELVVLPLLLGGGMQLTPSLSPAHGHDLRARACPPGRLGGDRLRRERARRRPAGARSRVVAGLAAQGLTHAGSVDAAGRGVRRMAAGRSRSKASADRPAASATPAAASIVAGGDTLSSCVPSVGASASPSHHDSPMAAM